MLLLAGCAAHDDADFAGIWIVNESPRPLVLRTDHFGEPYPRTLSFAVPPGATGIVPADGAAALVLYDARTCQVLARTQPVQERQLGVRVASDGSVTFVGDAPPSGGQAAEPLATAAACDPSP